MADSAVADLDELLNPARQVRRIFEGQWLVNVAYYLGQQWVRFDGSLLYNVEVGEERVTLTDNRIRGNVRSSIAKQTKSTPTWVGVPRNPSDEEIARARLRSIVFEHYWRHLQARRKLRSALWYRELCSAGFWKVCWDQSLGEAMTVIARKGGDVVGDAYGRPFTPDRVQAIPEELRDGLEERRLTLGDVHLELRSPFEMLVDPLATEEGLDSAEYVGEEAIHSLESLQRRYPDTTADLTESTSASAGIMETRFPSVVQALKHGRTDRGAGTRRGVKTREIWLPGGSRWGEKGKHVVYAVDGKVLLEENNPYPFKPYVMFGGLPAGRFWPDAPVNDQVSPQTELNKTKSQIAENAERIGNPARLRSSESMQDGADWQGLPGEEIVYQVVTGGPADVPSYLPGPEMPVYVQNLVPQAIESLNALSGNQEVAQGNVPEGVTAASAISQLLEASGTMLGPDMDETSTALEEAGKRVLWYLKTYSSTERLVQIAGEDSAWDVYSFRGDQLGDASPDEVQIGSGATTSVAQKQAGIQFLLNLFVQNGQVPPPRELRRLLRDYEVGGLEHFFGSVARDQNQVNEEHRRLLAGEMFDVNTFDNHELHVEEHQDFQKSSRYSELRRKPGGMQLMANIEVHVQRHRDELQAAANQAAAAQAAMAALESGNRGPGAAAVANGRSGPPPVALPSPPAV